MRMFFWWFQHLDNQIFSANTSILSLNRTFPVKSIILFKIISLTIYGKINYYSLIFRETVGIKWFQVNILHCMYTQCEEMMKCFLAFDSYPMACSKGRIWTKFHSTIASTNWLPINNKMSLMNRRDWSHITLPQRLPVFERQSGIRSEWENLFTFCVL